MAPFSWKQASKVAEKAAGGMDDSRPSSWLAALEADLLHPPSALSAGVGSALGLGGLMFAEPYVRTLLHDDTALLFVGSFGALSTLLYAAPAAPLGRPRNTFLGHIVSISVALTVHYTNVLLTAYFSWAARVREQRLSPTPEEHSDGALNWAFGWLGHGGDADMHAGAAGGSDVEGEVSAVSSLQGALQAAASAAAPPDAPWLSQDIEKVLTPSLAIAAMVHFKVPHPPAAACVVIYVTDAAKARQQGPLYLLLPALVGATYMIAVQLLLARTVRWLQQPQPCSARLACCLPPAIPGGVEVYGSPNASIHGGLHFGNGGATPAWRRAARRWWLSYSITRAWEDLTRARHAGAAGAAEEAFGAHAASASSVQLKEWLHASTSPHRPADAEAAAPAPLHDGGAVAMNGGEQGAHSPALSTEQLRKLDARPSAESIKLAARARLAGLLDDCWFGFVDEEELLSELRVLRPNQPDAVLRAQLTEMLQVRANQNAHGGNGNLLGAFDRATSQRSELL